MPHHNLQHFFRNSLPESHRTGECMARNMRGERKGAAESQTYAFEELVVFLIGGYLHLEVVALQYFPCDGQNGCDKLIPCLYAMSVNVVFSVNGYNVLFVVKRFSITVSMPVKVWKRKKSRHLFITASELSFRIR